MRRRHCNQWKKRWCGFVLLLLGIGMFLTLLLPSCIYIVATALVCAGCWLIYISRFH